MEKLTQEERRMIICALAAITPTGGGSRLYSLYRRLMEVWKVETTDELVDQIIKYQCNAAREWLS